MRSEIFNIFDLKDNKYLDILNDWYIKRNWQPIPASKTGIMIFDNEPICAGWLYSTDSAVCMIGNIISGFCEAKKKKEAFKKLLAKLEEEAKNKGFTIILFFVTIDSLANIAEQQGFERTGKVHELVKKIA